MKSIIIVGVGEADFTDMEILDGDDVRLSFQGEKAERDIVQFVPLSNFMQSTKRQIISQARLAQEVLREIPDQVTKYMRNRNIPPLQPVSNTDSATDRKETMQSLRYTMH